MILHVVTDFSTQGGAQAMLARLLSHSDERAVVVALTEVSDRCRAMAGTDKVEYISLHAKSPLSFPRAIWRIARLIRVHKPEVVLCWMYHAMVVGLIAEVLSMRRVPVIWTVRQALDDPAAFTRSTRMAVWLSQKLSRFCGGIIYNSTRALEQHTKFGFADANATVVPNGFHLPEMPQKRSGPTRVLGLAARFHPQKDFETFFRAFAIARRAVPDLTARLAGDGVTAENPALRELLAKNNLPQESVTLCGDLHDMADFYNSIDLLVLSSRTEGFPNVIAEAMSYGRPVVTTDVGDAATIVGDSGYVVPARDAQALGQSLTDAANWSSENYITRSSAARDCIANSYSLTAIAKAYDAVLSGVETQVRHPTATHTG
ncbi:glycosyltransferase [Rhodobacteraceae bacterium B1Z28]|uniref:Glycosyltransferase n=1 Tax=Ruegeria haliotis TaxID=2747601 RepID=A0ABX2PQE2_9RHOB|nr:glycosyltransferase [Ruegeria haliotis]NVO56370.1 glycosyltransferase [Ruegeria haliotis]